MLCFIYESFVGDPFSKLSATSRNNSFTFLLFLGYGEEIPGMLLVTAVRILYRRGPKSDVGELPVPWSIYGLTSPVIIQPWHAVFYTIF